MKVYETIRTGLCITASLPSREAIAVVELFLAKLPESTVEPTLRKYNGRTFT